MSVRNTPGPRPNARETTQGKQPFAPLVREANPVPAPTAATAGRSRGVTFTVEQRQELLGLGLFPEQVEVLENDALQSISWRQRPAPRMADVRETLAEFAEALGRVEQLDGQIYMLGTPARVEAASRIDMAQEALGLDSLQPNDWDKFHDSLKLATKIVQRALKDLPNAQRRWRLDYPLFMRRIMGALERGHAEHFNCISRGDAPSIEPMPAFRIRVARKRPPFPRVAEIVAEASGGWSVDDAIRAYLEWKREDQRQRHGAQGGKLASKNS